MVLHRNLWIHGGWGRFGIKAADSARLWPPLSLDTAAAAAARRATQPARSSSDATVRVLLHPPTPRSRCRNGDSRAITSNAITYIIITSEPIRQHVGWADRGFKVSVRNASLAPTRSSFVAQSPKAEGGGGGRSADIRITREESYSENTWQLAEKLCIAAISLAWEHNSHDIVVVIVRYIMCVNLCGIVRPENPVLGL